MRRLLTMLPVLGAIWLTACGKPPAPPAAETSTTTSTNPVDPSNSVSLAGASLKYDPARNPADDLKLAVAEATKTGKRILVEVGGEWCVWCHIMDKYFVDHPDLTKYRDEKYVLLRVNFSEENENKAFLSQYPKIGGYPHLYVLDSDGTLLHSQDTAQLESNRTYDLERFTHFLRQWAPSR